jgi:hypothetical protein
MRDNEMRRIIEEQINAIIILEKANGRYKKANANTSRVNKRKG